MLYKLDHIGYLTGDIESTVREFQRLGYERGGVFLDDTQQTRICFLKKNGEVRIELVEPYKDNKTMLRMLAKTRTSPYHLCYEVSDIEMEYGQMVQNGWAALFEPVPAPAFENRKICYFYKREIGYIELVNKQ